jgi:hypothetical protein
MSNPWCAFELERLDDARLASSTRRRFDAGERGTLAWPTLVENTGLEPVTSWLQTRRSPS